MNVSRRVALGGLLAMSTGTPLLAADWRPTRAMNWIVPFPPGGSNDTFARPIAAHVGEQFGQSVVVDNRSGAGGTLGGMIVARSRPDGCTLLVANSAQTFCAGGLRRIGLRFGAPFCAGQPPGQGARQSRRQSCQARRQRFRGFSRGGEEIARRHQHRLIGTRHHAASRHRTPAAAHGHQPDARSLPGRRASVCRT